MWPGWAKAETELDPMLSLQTPKAAVVPTLVKVQPVPDAGPGRLLVGRRFGRRAILPE